MSGVKAGLDQALETYEDEAMPQQVDMFADPANGAAASPMSASIPADKRGAGRPAGSTNKVTEAVRTYLLSQYRHPLIVMAEAYSMSPVQLAERLGMRQVQARDKAGAPVGEPYWPNELIFDLFKLQLAQAAAVDDKITPRAPQQVAVSQQPGVNIAFMGVSVPARAAGGENFAAGEAVQGEVMGVTIRAKSDV